MFLSDQQHHICLVLKKQKSIEATKLALWGVLVKNFKGHRNLEMSLSSLFVF